MGYAPPRIACPRSRPSRPTTPVPQALPPRPLAVQCANPPSTPPPTSAHRAPRPSRAGPRRPRPTIPKTPPVAPDPARSAPQVVPTGALASRGLAPCWPRRGDRRSPRFAPIEAVEIAPLKKVLDTCKSLHIFANFLTKAVFKEKPPCRGDLGRGFFGSLRFQRGSRPNSDSNLSSIRIIGYLPLLLT